MSYNSNEWRLLNGYADGELPDREAREFERRLADKPELRQDLDELRELKRKLAALRPAPGSPAPEQPAGVTSRRPRLRVAMAAAVAAVVILSGVALMLAGKTATWVEHAHALHAEQSKRAYVVEERHVVQTVSSGRTLEFRAPDLTASQLYLVDIATSTWDGREAIALHYRGLRGCRLTIVAIESAVDRESAPTAAGEPIWRHDGFAFTVIADGMDRDRFTSVADFARAAIVAPVTDAGLRTAMIETRQAARPCA